MLKTVLNILKVFDKNHNPYYSNLFGYSSKFWNKLPLNLQVVNLGSNTGLYGFRYDELNITAANWAMSPQSFNQDLAILKTYYSSIKPRGTVIVPLGPFSSCLKRYTDTEWLKYYTILKPEAMENFSLHRKQIAYKLRDYPWIYAYKDMIRGVISTIKTNGLKPRISPLDIDCQPLSSSELEVNANNFISGWKKQFKIADLDAPPPKHIGDGRKERIKSLKEIISFCIEKDFNYYIVLPPVTKSLSSKFSKIFRYNYIYSFLDEVGVPQNRFIDYLDDTHFTDDSLYVNSMFLNKKGGKLFTKRVLSDIGLI